MDDSKYLSERLLVRTNFRVCFNGIAGNPQIYIRVTTKEINTKGFVKNNDNRRKGSADMSVCCRYQYYCNQENNLKVAAFFFDNDMTLLFTVMFEMKAFLEFSRIFFTSTIRLFFFELNNKSVISVHIA